MERPKATPQPASLRRGALTADVGHASNFTLAAASKAAGNTSDQASVRVY